MGAFEDWYNGASMYIVITIAVVLVLFIIVFVIFAIYFCMRNRSNKKVDPKAVNLTDMPKENNTEVTSVRSPSIVDSEEELRRIPETNSTVQYTPISPIPPKKPYQKTNVRKNYSGSEDDDQNISRKNNFNKNTKAINSQNYKTNRQIYNDDSDNNSDYDNKKNSFENRKNKGGNQRRNIQSPVFTIDENEQETYRKPAKHTKAKNETNDKLKQAREVRRQSPDQDATKF